MTCYIDFGNFVATSIRSVHVIALAYSTRSAYCGPWFRQFGHEPSHESLSRHELGILPVT